MTVHGITLGRYGLPFTRCGIRLSESDTGVTFFGAPVEITAFDDRITCDFCSEADSPMPVSTPTNLDRCGMFFIERFNGRGWCIDPAGNGLPSRSEALQVIERLRGIYGSRAVFRIVVR